MREALRREKPASQTDLLLEQALGFILLFPTLSICAAFFAAALKS